MKIIDAIINIRQESRKEGMLEEWKVISDPNYRDQFWQHENHPILLNNKKMYNERLIYLHENPERAGFVRHPVDWKFSSAIDYYTEEGKGLLELIRLDWGLW